MTNSIQDEYPLPRMANLPGVSGAAVPRRNHTGQVCQHDRDRSTSARNHRSLSGLVILLVALCLCTHLLVQHTDSGGVIHNHNGHIHLNVTLEEDHFVLTIPAKDSHDPAPRQMMLAAEARGPSLVIAPLLPPPKFN